MNPARPVRIWHWCIGDRPACGAKPIRRRGKASSQYQERLCVCCSALAEHDRRNGGKS